ncbi:hypothetical protein [uncultured Catenibacterium sp.]|uniref:hypothetical protein n=1 Tax=uncultured Catenibacterium sp. TaxID=286142 RepID=UPI0025E6E455|nr:hypothetical protein [uncultured Catenibacterium sp.]
MSKNLFKKIGASFVAFTLAFSCTSAVSATGDNSEFKPTVTYNKGDYTFGKISHPDKGVSTTDGIVDYLGGGNVGVTGQDQGATGQGDAGQSYSWAATSYGDWMYVGTCYAASGNTLALMDSALGSKFDEEVMSAALKTLYNGTFFYGHEKEDGTADDDSLGILVKINVKTGEVKLLMSASTTGQSPTFRNAITYKDKLYFCGSVTNKGLKMGLPAIYCIDPKTDDIKCVYTGLAPAELGAAYKEGICSGIRGMTEFNGKFIASCVGLNGPYILESTDPSAGQSSFKKIATKEDLFNYPAYHFSDSIYGGSIWEMVEFNNSLYVALCTGTEENKPNEKSMQSFAIVRGDRKSDGTWTWTPVVGDKADGAKYTFGIDPERTRAGACNLVVYKDHLYIGEYEDIEIALKDLLFNTNVEFMANNIEQSVSLYRMDKDENMELVVGDATQMFPKGGISGISSGFGHRENQYIWQSKVYDGKLYFGTFDSSSLLQPLGQFTNGDLLKMSKEEWKSQLNYLKVFIELLLSKYIEYPTQPATVAETDSSLTASEKVQKAIESASKRYSGTQTASAASDNNVETIKLTTEQINTLVKGIEDGSIKANSLNKKISAELFTIISGMDPMADSLNKKGTQEFVDQYVEVYEYYNEISANIPDDLKKLFDILITATKKDNLIAFGKLLKYLSTAQRGFDMYVTSDGETFSTITTNGFNDPYNHGCRVFATGDDWMAIGTANPFYGTQLWKMTSPVKTVEPTTPTDPEKPDPSNPDQPSEPDKPSNPDQPSEPDKPSNPDQPSEPDKPSNPDQPSEPEKPSNPDQPSEPDKPSNPDQPTEPGKPSDSDKPAITVKPSNSDKKDTTTVTTKTDSKKATAKTGDSTDIATLLVTTIGSLALLIGAAFVLRKKKTNA